MSQNSQSNLLPRLSLPLLKFSYASVAEGASAPIPWRHIASRNDMFVVLDTFEAQGLAGATELRHRFQVFIGPDTLEDIDLNILAGQAQKAVTHTSQSLDSRGFPAITIIARLPCLAMRYPLSGARVRRFQVRFAEAESYYETMKLLSQLSIPVSEACQNPPAPQSFHVQHATNQCTGHITGDLVRRPSTTTGYESVGVYGRQNGIGAEFRSDENHTRPFTSHETQTYHLPTPTLQSWGPENVPMQFGTVNAIRNANDQSTSASNLSVMPGFVPSTSAAINLYTPRPQPIGVAAKDDSTDSMPPRRELPFNRRTKTSTNDNVIHKTFAKAQSPVPSMSQEGEPDRIGELPTASEVVPANGKQVVRSRTEKAPPKRPRSTTTRKKSEPRTKKQATPVPSVEQILQKMTKSDPLKTVPADNATLPSIDRIDQQAQTQISQLDQSEQAAAAPDHNAKHALAAAQPVLSLAKQLIEPSDPAAVTTRCYALQPKNGQNVTTACEALPCASKTAPKKKQPDDITSRACNHASPDMNKFNLQAPQETPSAATSSPEHHQQPSQRQRAVPDLLTSNPTLLRLFTQKISLAKRTTDTTGQKTHEGEETTQEKSLTDADIHRDLETWVCQQIDNPEFVALCRAIDGVVGRAFVYF